MSPRLITSEQARAMNAARKAKRQAKEREARSSLAAELATMALGRPLSEQEVLFRAAAEAITYHHITHPDPALAPSWLEAASWDLPDDDDAEIARVAEDAHRRFWEREGGAW